MDLVCEVCGNDLESAVSLCPFCGSKNETAEPTGFRQKTINLEAGRPLLEQAMARLVDAIDDARRNKVQVLTLIHGYGSSGKGGVIRIESRKTLDFMKAKGQINDYLPGEDFNKRLAPAKNVLRRYPALLTHLYLGKANKGITLVILK